MFVNKNLLTIKSLGLGALLLGLVQTPVMGFSLDLFTDFEGTNVFQRTTISAFSGQNATNSDIDTSLDSTVFGGQRTIKLTKTNSGLNLNDIGLTVFNGTAGLSVPDAEAVAEIIWDGNDGIATDFTDDGGVEQKSFQINIQSLNIGTGDGDISLNFEFEDTSGNKATITQQITSNIGSPTDVFFSYSNRVESTEDAGGDVNLMQIDYARFYTSDENDGDDFVFNFVQTSEIPFTFTPGLGLLISGGFVGFLGIRSKKAQKEDLTTSE